MGGRCSRLLAVSCANKSSVCLWDVLATSATILRIPLLQYVDIVCRVGITTLHWSPCGLYLFAATT